MILHTTWALIRADDPRLFDIKTSRPVQGREYCLYPEEEASLKIQFSPVELKVLDPRPSPTVQLETRRHCLEAGDLPLVNYRIQGIGACCANLG